MADCFACVKSSWSPLGWADDSLCCLGYLWTSRPKRSFHFRLLGAKSRSTHHCTQQNVSFFCNVDLVSHMKECVMLSVLVPLNSLQSSHMCLTMHSPLSSRTAKMCTLPGIISWGHWRYLLRAARPEEGNQKHWLSQGPYFFFLLRIYLFYVYEFSIWI